MTVNKLTRTLKAKGYEMYRYTLWLNSIFKVVTYTEYAKDGKLAIETKRIKGEEEETKVYFINKDFKEEFKEMGIEVGTILK